MRYSFSRGTGYTKRKLLADVLMTLKSMKISVTGRVVAELLEVAFATLQQALLQRGSVELPGIGELRIRVIDDRPQYFFTPSVEITRRIRAAMAEDET
jgi:nucleoid DNA-binding protein